MESQVQSVFAIPAQDKEVDLDVEAYLTKFRSGAIPPVFETALKSIQPDITGKMLEY
jgi:hypothetical protein